MASVTDRFLQETLTSAKLGHKFDVITELITQCQDVGAIAEQAGVVEKCIYAVVDCWLISPKFSRRYTFDSFYSHDDEAIKKLGEFPLDWYKLLCVTAREKSVRPTVLANLVQSYISQGVEAKYRPKQSKTTTEQSKAEEKPAESESDSSSSDNEDDDNKSEEDKEPKKEKPKKEERPKAEAKKVEAKPTIPDLDIGKIMDALLFEVPLDNPLMVESFCPKWVIEMLKIAQEVGCDSKEVLLIIASRMLHRYSKDDLAGLPAEILSQIIAEGCKDSHIDPDDVCRVLDGYLMDQAKNDELTVQTFQKLVDAVPKDSRASHDMLFQVLETLLKSGEIPECF
jgi:hypothetical protein